MLNWINQLLNINLQDDDMESIRNFSLMWNLYEKTTCNTNYNHGTISNIIANNNFQIQDFQTYVDYFQNRYVDNSQLNQRFPQLHLRGNDQPQLVEDVLLGNNTNGNDMILVCSIIVYRFRCNLFHGTLMAESRGEARSSAIVERSGAD